MNRSFRASLQQGIYTVINPFVRLLIKAGLTPNMVTTIGLVLNIGVAVIFVIGAEEGNRGDLSYVGWAGALVLFAGLFDMLDGQVARLGNMSSAFGALYDSVLDRYSELILFLGICYYLIAHHYFLSSLSAFIALIGSMMVSYTRARAEGLGIESKGGLMQRPERIILIGVSASVCGITSAYIGGNYKLFVTGIPFHVFETMSIFTIPIVIMAVLTNITAINRLRDAKKAMESKEGLAKESAPKQKAVSYKSAIHILSVVLFTFFVATVTGKDVHGTLPVSDPQDTFPMPKNIEHLMFYIQRTPNTNTICYELNIAQDGQLNTDDPIHPFWLRYAEEQGKRKELNFIQRKFAYGLKVKKLQRDNYEVRSVAYAKKVLYLRKGIDNKYHVYTNISNTLAILNRIFINIDGGTFWYPNVTFIELKGLNATTGKPVSEKIKP